MKKEEFYKLYMNFFYRYYRLNEFKNIFSSTYYSLRTKSFKADPKYSHEQYIPIVINNFNRLQPLETLINWLLKDDLNVFIIIIDNMSTYKPLLDYYKGIDHPDIHIKYYDFNWGNRMILPISMSLKKFKYFIVSDPDLIPPDISFKMVLEKMKDVLNRFPDINHVGGSLEINDIPDHYPLKSKVLQWESKFWQNKIEDIFIADVDTTFAMYRQSSKVRARFPAARLDRPYTFRHSDWYVNPENLSDEYAYYLESCSQIASWAHTLMNEQNIELKGRNKENAELFKSYY